MRIMMDLLRVAGRSVPCVMLTVSLAYGAQNYYMNIESAKQGAFNAGVSRKGSLWIPVLEVSQPAGGERLGTTRHKPIVVIKEIDAASAVRSMTVGTLLGQKEIMAGCNHFRILEVRNVFF